MPYTSQRSTLDIQRLVSVECALRSIDSLILHERRLPDILQHVCDQLTAQLGYEVAWIGLKELDGTLAIGAISIPAPHRVSQTSMRWDDPPGVSGVAQRAIQTGEVQLVRAMDSRLAKCQAMLPTLPLGAALAVPISFEAEVVGVLCLYAASSSAFGPGSMEEALGFANQVALSLRVVYNQEQIRLQTAALRETVQAVIITDTSGRIQWVNPAFTRLTGYEASEAIGNTPRLLKSGLTTPEQYEEFWSALQSGQAWRGDFCNRRKDGTLYHSEQTVTPVRDDAGRITHFVTLQHDVTERRLQADRVRYLAMHDDLTGLPNRRAVREKLEETVGQASSDSPSAMLLMDLDNLKMVNDSLGHAAGDQLLTDLAERIQRSIRSVDFVGRLGGDEFAVILPGRNSESAFLVAQRIREEISTHLFEYGGHTFDISASMGVILIDGDKAPDQLMTKVDSALYAAKNLGKNRVVMASGLEEETRGTAGASKWVTLIQEALRRESVVLHYQPVVNLQTGTVRHYEVLLRLQDPQGGLFYPEHFMPAAYRYGLMTQIDRCVLRHSVALLKSQPQAELFVNISGMSLGDETLFRMLDEWLQGNDQLARRLIFEITETAAIVDLEQAQLWMERLRERGCRFALDDFGSGFSSFTYLRQLPVDFIKIDGSFVRNLESEPSNRTVVQALAAVAHALGKSVVAECVESASAVSLLLDLGIEFGQGYHLGRPNEASTIFRT